MSDGRFTSETGAEAGKVAKKFRPEFVDQARKLALLGLTDYEIGSFLEVSERTINRWKYEHEEFGAALTIGKDAADDRVERALFHKAVGYTYASERIFCDKGEIVRAETAEHVPPSDTAAIFWLKNRRKEQWRDSSQIDHSSADGSMSPQPPVYQIAEK